MPKAKESFRGLGAKYGGTLRKRYARVFRTLKQARSCPACASKRLARTSSGIWKCKSCGYTVAGGAFVLTQAKAI